MQRENQNQNNQNENNDDSNESKSKDNSKNSDRMTDWHIDSSIDKVENLSSFSGDQERVAMHYNSMCQNSHEERENSRIIQSRRLHNWIKSVLISLFTRENSIVLDIGSGKGGDLFKYKNQNISELVLVDHALNSLNDGMARYNENIDKGTIRYPLHLICCDAFNKNLDLIFNKCAINNNTNTNNNTNNSKHSNLSNIIFDIVSSQFVIHYAFESKSRVLALLHNVCKRLRPDGYFIGTTPDANVLIKKWRKDHEIKFSNDNYQVQFDVSGSIENHSHSNHNSNSSSSPPNQKNNTSNSNNKLLGKDFIDDPFGIRYFFRLSDAVNDCPEYLLHFPTFVKMASEEPFNLELVLDMNFHEFFVTFCDNPKYQSLLKRRMKVGEGMYSNTNTNTNSSNSNSNMHSNSYGNQNSNSFSINDNMWDIAYLYKVFAFRKKPMKNGQDNYTAPISSDRNIPKAERLGQNDILVVE